MFITKHWQALDSRESKNKVQKPKKSYTKIITNAKSGFNWQLFWRNTTSISTTSGFISIGSCQWGTIATEYWAVMQLVVVRLINDCNPKIFTEIVVTRRWFRFFRVVCPILWLFFNLHAKVCVETIAFTSKYSLFGSDYNCFSCYSDNDIAWIFLWIDCVVVIVTALLSSDVVIRDEDEDQRKTFYLLMLLLTLILV